MTEDQVMLVRRSWEQVRGNPATAELFYSRLFELDPGLRPLFTTEMSVQRRRLVSMVDAAVEELDRLDRVVPAIRAIGRRHAGYGVHAADYDTFGDALLWMLEQRLGDDYDDHAREAWAAAYGLLADGMRSAAPVAA
jgi:hemoglobin-like flavoprotein